jgi:hypothetical protein
LVKIVTTDGWTLLTIEGISAGPCGTPGACPAVAWPGVGGVGCAVPPVVEGLPGVLAEGLPGAAPFGAPEVPPGEVAPGETLAVELPEGGVIDGGAGFPVHPDAVPARTAAAPRTRIVRHTRWGVAGRGFIGLPLIAGRAGELFWKLIKN